MVILRQSSSILWLSHPQHHVHSDDREEEEASLLPESLGPELICVTSALTPSLRTIHQVTSGCKQELGNVVIVGKPLPKNDYTPKKNSKAYSAIVTDCEAT